MNINKIAIFDFIYPVCRSDRRVLCCTDDNIVGPRRKQLVTNRNAFNWKAENSLRGNKRVHREKNQEKATTDFCCYPIVQGKIM